MAYVHYEILTNANHIHMAFEEFLENSLNVIHRINEFVSMYGAFYSLLMDIGTRLLSYNACLQFQAILVQTL